MRLEYVGKYPIYIPLIKSRGGDLRLPLTNDNTGKSADTQIVDVTDNEAKDLLRCWPSSFVAVNNKEE